MTNNWLSKLLRKSWRKSVQYQGQRFLINVNCLRRVQLFRVQHEQCQLSLVLSWYFPWIDQVTFRKDCSCRACNGWSDLVWFLIFIMFIQFILLILLTCYFEQLYVNYSTSLDEHLNWQTTAKKFLLTFPAVRNSPGASMSELSRNTIVPLWIKWSPSVANLSNSSIV